MPETFYAGTAVGIFKSTDGGATLTGVNTGLPGLPTDGVVIDPATPATVYSTAGGGIFKSTDAGGHYAPIKTGSMGGFVLTLAIDPVTPTTLYAGMDRDGVVKSTDGGEHWAAANSGLEGSYGYPVSISTLAIDPTMPSTVYATTGGTYLTERRGAFKTTDGGASWTAINVGFSSSPGVGALAIDPAGPATLYAGVNTIIPDNYGYSYPTRYDLYKSTDGGGSWTPLGTGGGRALAIDPAIPGTVYSTARDYSFYTSSGGVLKTTDAGASWQPVNVGLDCSVVTALMIDPTLPATLYAGTMDNGVFESTNGGGRWTAINTGLTNLQIRALAIDPAKTGTTVYAATGRGAFTFEFDGAFPRGSASSPTATSQPDACDGTSTSTRPPTSSTTTTTRTSISSTTSTTTTLPCTTARCVLDAGLTSPTCTGEAVPVRVTRNFNRGASLIERATGSSVKQTKKLLERAKRALERAGVQASRAAKRSKRRLSEGCSAALRSAAEQVRGGLAP